MKDALFGKETAKTTKLRLPTLTVRVLAAGKVRRM